MKNKKKSSPVQLNITTTVAKSPFQLELSKYECPKTLVMDELKWKYLVRSVIRGKNVLLLGATGSGKNHAAQTLTKVLNREDNYHAYNLGSCQDARTSLIGNTQFDKSTGTLFKESSFIKAIRTPNAIIILDEISRCTHDGVNILMSVLDDLQRYVRLDEKNDNEVVKVAQGVTFIATANVGNEYTATRVMDRALLNRFPVKIEMSPLSKDPEFELLKNRFNISDENQLDTLNAIIEISCHTREQIKLEESKLTNFISTRSTVEMTELIIDGFSLLEIAEMTIYPNFSEDGGMDNERTYMKQLVQKYVKSETDDKLFHDPVMPVDDPEDAPF